MSRVIGIDVGNGHDSSAFCIREVIQGKEGITIKSRRLTKDEYIRLLSIYNYASKQEKKKKTGILTKSLDRLFNDTFVDFKLRGIKEAITYREEVLGIHIEN